MSVSHIEQAASRLWDAAKSGQPCAPVRDLIGDHDQEVAYAVQRVNIARRLSAGAVVTGCKIGLTSPAVQQQLGVSQPDFGMLLNTMSVPEGQTVLWRELMQPKAEAEVAFVLCRDLTGDITESSLRHAVEYAVAAIEVVGSRIANWDIRVTDTIADNASASHYVLGSERRSLSEVDLVNCEMQMWRGDELVSKGKGSACMGSPIVAAIWLAQTMQRMGTPLRAGMILLTGALGPMVAANPGDRFRAAISTLGEVHAEFGQPD